MAGSVATRFSALIYPEPPQDHLKSQAHALAEYLAIDPYDELFPREEESDRYAILEHMSITHCLELAPGIQLTPRGFKELCIASVLQNHNDVLQFLLEGGRFQTDLSEALEEATKVNNEQAKRLLREWRSL